MRRPKRPYFSLVVFLALLLFAVFIAWQSGTWQGQMAATSPGQPGRVVYLPLAVQRVCSQPPCPPVPTAPAYPAAWRSGLSVQPSPGILHGNQPRHD